MASTQTRLPSRTWFLMQTIAFIVVAFLSTPNFSRPDATGVIVMLIIALIFLGIGWLVFRLFHRVEWQYLQGFGERGYARLKGIRWITVGLITLALMTQHWQNHELASPLWAEVLLSYWSTWMSVWFVSLWVLWPIAYYKKPTESADYFWRNWPESETPQPETTQPKATWRELTVLRVNTFKPVFWLAIWAAVLAGLYRVFPHIGTFIFVAILVMVLFNGVVSVLASLALMVFCILEAVLRRIFALPKYLTAKDMAYIDSEVERQTATDQFIKQEVHVKRDPTKGNFWLGVIAGAIGISLISGCDNE